MSSSSEADSAVWPWRGRSAGTGNSPLRYDPELESRRAYQAFSGLGVRVSPHFSIGVYGKVDTFEDERPTRFTIGPSAAAKF
jgi:hypothetical protein